MKSATTLLLGGVVVSVFFAAGAMAEGTIYTRSADAAHADLVRDWNYRATGANTGIVRQRTVAEMNADLVRNWNGPAKAAVSAEEKRALHTRTAEQAHNDLMRNWN